VETKIYTTKLTSQTNSIALVIALVLLLAVVVVLIVPNGGYPFGITIIISILTISIFWLLWQKFVTGIAEWTISESTIKIEWTKPFFMSEVKNDCIIWSDIADIHQKSEPLYDSLTLVLISGQTLKVYHYNMTRNDDFTALADKLTSTSNIYRKKSYRQHPGLRQRG
jgi:hypothetical protein